MKIIDQIGIRGQPANAAVQPPWLELIRDAVGALDFGSVEVKVHSGEVVQIETTRKIRVPSRSANHPTAPAEGQQPR